jgi:hypothetical protein
MPAVRASTLLVSLVGNFVGLDDHKGLTLPGAASAAPETATQHLGDGGKGTADASDEEDGPYSLSGAAAPSSSSSSSSSSSNLCRKMSEESDVLSKAAPRPKSLPKKPKSGEETSQPIFKTSEPVSDMSLGNLDQFRHSESTAKTTNPASDMSLDNLDHFRNFESTAKTPKPVRDTFRYTEGGGPASAQKVNPSSNTCGAEDECSKSGSAKSPILRGTECGNVPRAGTFSRKGSVGNRDIRDCLNVNPLNTIRRKATEMNLLENVKSSKLTGQLYTSPDQPVMKPFGTADGRGSASLHLGSPLFRTPTAPPSSGKISAPLAGGVSHMEIGAPLMRAPTTEKFYFKRQPTNDAFPPFEQRSQLAPQKTEPQQHYGLSAAVRVPSSQNQQVHLDSRNHHGPQAPPSTPNQDPQQHRLQYQHKSLTSGMPTHTKAPGQMVDARYLSQPAGSPTFSALPERKTNALPFNMSRIPRQFGPPPASMPRSLVGPPLGAIPPWELPNFPRQAPLHSVPIQSLSALQQNRKQPVRTNPNTNNESINVKRSRSIQEPQYRAQHHRPVEVQGISEVRVPFANAPFSQTDFDKFF